MRRRGLNLRLRTMMFLQFFLNGTILPIFSLYLRDFLHFSGTQAGLIIGMSAASSFVSPVLASLVADRLLRAERLYGVCHAVGGFLMLILSLQHRFLPVLVVYLVYILVYGPTNALTNVITLHHQPDALHRFGGIRLWGTVGWVAVAWLFGFLWLSGGGGTHLPERLPDALKLSSIVSFVLAAYSLTLPRSPVTLLGVGGSRRRAARATGAPVDNRISGTGLLPKEAFRVLGDPQVLLFIVASFLVYSMDTYYYFGAAPIFLDSRSTDVSRSGVQQLFTIATTGLGAFVGNLTAGRVFDLVNAHGPGASGFRAYWIVPAAAAVAVAMMMLLAFKDSRRPKYDGAF